MSYSNKILTEVIKLPEFDLLIKNAKMFDEYGSLIEVCLGVISGKISFIGFNCPDFPIYDFEINARGFLLLPSFIDLHAHIFSPGWNKENYSTGTMAAAVGGYGLVCDMASVGAWQTTTKEVFEKKVEEIRKDAWVDVALYAGEIYKDSDLIEIPELMDMGAIGLGEIMLSEPGPIGDDALLLRAMEIVARKNKFIAVHCENKDLVNYAMRTRRPVKDLRRYASTRPPIAEAEAILRVATLSRHRKTRVHVCHVSSKIGLSSLRLTKHINKHITSEVTPHHLLLDVDNHYELGKLGVVTPPLRRKEDRVELWRSLTEGLINVVSTDHASFYVEDKERPADYTDVPPGLPELEFAFSVVSTYAVEHNIATLKDVVDWFTRKPAKILGIFPKRGVISIGAEADVVLVDYGKEVKTDDSWIFSATDYSPYLGWKVKFRVMYNVVRGGVVLEDGIIASKKGEFIKI